MASKAENPTSAPAPDTMLKPRPRLFLGLLVAFGLWLAGLILLNFLT